MTRRSATLSLGWFGVLFVVLWSARAGASEQARERLSPNATKSGVLVELFTSQGCSSCPPADRFLSELADRADLEVIPLSFHVDYWNYIGWTDPFSSPRWSDRQRRYAKVFGGDRIYTPQIVVAGRWEGVGSQRQEISRLLERATAEPVLAQWNLSTELLSNGRLQLVLGANRLDPALRSKKLKCWVAIVESDLVTLVRSGENASKRLRNDRVVRYLRKVLEFGPAAHSSDASFEIVLEDDWRRDRLSVVVFLQDSDSLRIYGATESAITTSE